MRPADGIREALSREKTGIPWNCHDKERIAGLYIRLLDLGPEAMSAAERAEAAKYCKVACYSATYGTASLEYVPLFSRYARLADPAGTSDPFLTVDCLKAEAGAAGKLGRENLPLLRRVLRLLRQPPLQSPALRTDRITKTASVLRSMAEASRRAGRPARALRLAGLAIAVFADKNTRTVRKPSAKMLGLILYRAGLLCEAGATAEATSIIRATFPPETTPPPLAVTVAALFTRRTDRSAAENDAASAPYLAIAADWYKKKGQPGSPAALPLLDLLLDRAIRTGDHDGVLAAYTETVEALRLHRCNFLLPENLDQYLEDAAAIHVRMLEYCQTRGDLPLAARVIGASYWSLPLLGGAETDREAALKTAALTRPGRQETLHKTRELPDLLAGDGDRIIFHVLPDRIIRLSRLAGTTAFTALPCRMDTLLRETAGLLNLTTDPARLPGLFRATVEDFRTRLFAGLAQDLSPTREVSITANPPLASLPWPLLSPGARLVFRPGNAPASRPTPPAGGNFFSLAEDGTTLPAAREEHNFLKDLYPAGLHIIAAGREPHAEEKAAILQGLSRAGIFHFAGHGFSHPRLPERSGLLLRGNPLHMRQEDVLSFQEISALDLSGIRLAFLNSCSSGQGRNFSGGIQLTMATAFLQAGVRALIVSCNPVADNLSLEFTRAFYTRLAAAPDADPGEVFYRTHRDLPEAAAPYLLLGQRL